MATFSYCRVHSTHFFGNFFCLFYLLFSSPSFSFFLQFSPFDFSLKKSPDLFFQCTILCNLWIFLPSFFPRFLFETPFAILFTNLENDLLTCRLFFFLKKGLLVQVPLPHSSPSFCCVR